MREKIVVDDIFLKNLPYIDLHGYTGDMARVATMDFINNNYMIGVKKVLIIHGIGKGIVKKYVHNELKNNKYVKNFYLDGFNSGYTIVFIKDNL